MWRKTRGEPSGCPNSLLVDKIEDIRREADHNMKVDKKETPMEKGNSECWYCWKKGHFKRDCHSRKKFGKECGQNQENNHKVNMVGDYFDKPLILS